MTILGIKNRTENWKTAVYFSPLFGGHSSQLAERLGAEPRPQPGEVRLELFWRGMRDLLHQREWQRKTIGQELVDIYLDRFPSLRNAIVAFQEFKVLRPKNYAVSTEDGKANLVNNLLNTEVDVVLETPNHLFIGEAKHEMTFSANGNLTLVHQLIRQYVTATVLVEISTNPPRKQVIPFVVGDDVGSLNKTSQVRFMISQGWLRKENVLSWDEIKSAD